MDLDQLANLGEFVGGVAVLVTLIYVAFQVRNARRQLDEQSVSSAIDSLMTSFDPAYLDSNAPIFRRGLAGEDLSDPDERYIFEMLMHRQGGAAIMLARTEAEVGAEMIAGLRGLVWGHPGARRWLDDLPAGRFKHSILEALREPGSPS